VFTSLCEQIGVSGVQFEEVYSLGPEAFASFEADKVHGLVFLFKWRQEADERPTVDAKDFGLFFAQQVITNACATQAILSMLMNMQPGRGVEIGPHLQELKTFTQDLDPQMAGLAIGNSQVIRTAHNSFHAQSSFEIVRDKDEKGDDAFHFIGYIHHGGQIFELDGLKKGPIHIGEVPEGTPWVEQVRDVIQKRIDSYTNSAAAGEASAEERVELRFNLMAMVANKKAEAEKMHERQRFLRQRVNINLISRGEDIELADELEDDDAPEDIPTFEDLSTREIPDLQGMLAECNSEIERLQSVIDEEKKRRDKWDKENKRRRHDFVPLVLCAMRHLAKKKQLISAFQKGKEVTLKRAEEKKALEVKAA